MSVTEKQDYFALFQLHINYVINVEDLHKRYQKTIAQVHPDNFPLGLAFEKKWACDYSALINEAYNTLCCPVKRANYILNLLGLFLDLETDTAMSNTFLLEQMTLQEKIIEAKNSQNNEKIKKVKLMIDNQLQSRITLFAKGIKGIVDLYNAENNENNQGIVDTKKNQNNENSQNNQELEKNQSTNQFLKDSTYQKKLIQAREVAREMIFLNKLIINNF